LGLESAASRGAKRKRSFSRRGKGDRIERERLKEKLSLLAGGWNSLRSEGKRREGSGERKVCERRGR